MINSKRSSCLLATAFVLGHGAGLHAAADHPADRLVSAVLADASVPQDAKVLLKSTWDECDGCNEAEFMAQALSVLSAKFRDLLSAYEDESYENAVKAAAELKSHPNRFIAVNAAAYEVLSLSASNRFEEAAQQAEKLLEADEYKDFADHSYLTSEISFVRGYCLVSDLQFEEGAAALSTFLADHPEAPIRLTVAARQMLVELQNREEGNINEVVDLMRNSHGRLQTGDTGKVVQARQQRVLDLLDKLIKDAEAHECKCKSSSQSQQQGKKQGSQPRPDEQQGGLQQKPQQGQQWQQNPMEESRLPGPVPSSGSLREARRANPAETWGNMPPLERERILQAIRESFPSRYRQLVEQYYEELAKKP